MREVEDIRQVQGSKGGALSVKQSGVAMVVALVMALSDCTSSPDTDDDDASTQYVPPCTWKLTISVDNQLDGNLEIDYYLIQNGGESIDYGTTKVVRPGMNTYTKYASCEASSFDFRIAAYYAGGETHGPEQQCRFTNPTDDDLTVEFVIENNRDTSGRVIFPDGNETACQASY